MGNVHDDQIWANDFEDHAPVAHADAVMPFPGPAQRLGARYNLPRLQAADHGVEPDAHRDGQGSNLDLSFPGDDDLHDVLGNIDQFIADVNPNPSGARRPRRGRAHAVQAGAQRRKESSISEASMHVDPSVDHGTVHGPRGGPRTLPRASLGLSKYVLSWDGSYAARFIHGSTTVLSVQASGMAFSINKEWNPTLQEPGPTGSQGSVHELVESAAALGFTWGGNYSRPSGALFVCTAR